MAIPSDLPSHASTVCFFNSSKSWGGGEKWHFEAAVYFHAKGYRVLVVTNPGSELAQRVAKAGVPLFACRIGNLSFLNPLLLYRLRECFLKEGVGTLFINLSADLKAASLAGRWAGVPHIIYRRGLAKAVKGSWLNRLLLGKVVTHIMANSNETKQLLLQQLNGAVPESKVAVIYNGLDFDAYLQQQRQVQEDMPEGVCLIGNLGRLSEQKGQRYLIEMARLLKERGFAFHVLIAGAGELEAELRAQIATAGVADCVTLLGFQDQVRGFLEAIDIFVLTSLWEGFGYVLAEASFFEKPLVAFDISSNPEVLVHGQTGYLVPPANVQALANQVAALIENPQLRKTLGEAGRQHVLETFPFSRCMAQVEQQFFFQPTK